MERKLASIKWSGGPSSHNQKLKYQNCKNKKQFEFLTINNISMTQQLKKLMTEPTVQTQLSVKKSIYIFFCVSSRVL